MGRSTRYGLIAVAMVVSAGFAAGIVSSAAPASARASMNDPETCWDDDLEGYTMDNTNPDDCNYGRAVLCSDYTDDISGGTIVFDLVKVKLDADYDLENGMALKLNCGNRDSVTINRLEVDQWHGIAVDVISSSRNITVNEGYINCWSHSFNENFPQDPDVHQDAITALGGENVTFKHLTIRCYSSNSHSLYVNAGNPNKTCQQMNDEAPRSCPVGITIEDSDIMGGGTTVMIHKSQHSGVHATVGPGGPNTSTVYRGPGGGIDCGANAEWCVGDDQDDDGGGPDDADDHNTIRPWKVSFIQGKTASGSDTHPTVQLDGTTAFSHFLVACFAWNEAGGDADVSTAPVDWTYLTGQERLATGGGVDQQCYYRKLNRDSEWKDNDGATADLVLTGAKNWVATIAEYRAPEINGDPNDQSATAQGTSTSATTGTTSAVSDTDELFVGAISNDNSNSQSYSGSDYTSRLTVATAYGSNNVRTALYDRVIDTSDGTGTPTAGLSVSISGLTGARWVGTINTFYEDD